MKRVTALLIAIIMMIISIPAYARDGIHSEFDGVTGELRLNGYGSVTSEVIESVLKKLDTGLRGLASVIIEGDIEEIADGAFRNYRTVSKITVTAPIKRIGKRAF